METRGAQNARAELFEGATWYLTPLAETEPARLRDLHRLLAALGATPVAIDAGVHDRLLAVTSHLPHALANLLVVQAGEARIDGHDPLTAIGGSFRDMTRVAGANPRIWVDIFLDNREALAGVLREHQRALGEVLTALEAGDAGYLARWIGQASGHRRRALEAQFDQRPEELYRVQVHVPDRPGVFAGITQALGAARINIEDFELHHFTPERGGTIELLVAGPRGRRARRRAARRAGLRRARRARAGGRDVSAATGSDRLEIAPAAALVGEIAVPGDKSISHRALLIGAVCDGTTEVTRLRRQRRHARHARGRRGAGRARRAPRRGARRACASTAAACAACTAPDGPIDVHNAGTLMRLLPGLLVGQSGSFTLDGDESIRRRPVDRVAHAAAADGRRARRQRRPPAAAHRRRRRAAADRLRAAGRIGAGQVLHPARGPLRGHRARRP